MHTLLLLGHRGDRQAGRENTISSFDRALANGCDGFEFDLRITRDGQAVVFHDAKISGISIARNTFSRLRELDASREDDHLTLLDNILARYAASAFLDIELKVPGLEGKLIALLKQHPIARGYVISSFLPEVIETLAGEDQNLPLGFICDGPRVLPGWRELPVQYVIPNYRLVRADLVSACHRAKCKVLVWTVNNPSIMQEMADLGVDGIISDDTKLLVKTLRP